MQAASWQEAEMIEIESAFVLFVSVASVVLGFIVSIIALAITLQIRSRKVNRKLILLIAGVSILGIQITTILLISPYLFEITYEGGLFILFPELRDVDLLRLLVFLLVGIIVSMIMFAIGYFYLSKKERYYKIIDKGLFEE